MNALFLLSAFFKLGKKIFSKDEKDGYAELAADYCCNLIDSITGNYAYDKYTALAERFSKEGLPVNHDIQKATEKALILAALESVKFSLRSPSTGDASDTAKLKVIRKFLDASLREIEASNYTTVSVNPAANEIVYLQLVPGGELPSADEMGLLETRLLDYLVDTKLVYALYVHYSDTDTALPKLLSDAILYGWVEKGRNLTVFNFMCDYFHEFLKEDHRLGEIIQKQWLGSLIQSGKESAAAVNKLLTQFQDLGQNSIAVVGRLDSILSFVNPQPLLNYRENELKKDQFAHFKSRYSPFLGRESSLDLLKSFFFNEQISGWTLITGPGGSGKSRLALELCYTLSEMSNLHAGFMTRYEFTKFNWLNWQPDAPTLIILDYASSLYKDFIELMEVYEKKKSLLRFPVRWLLIERFAEGANWWKELENAYSKLKIIPPPLGNTIKLESPGGSLLKDIVEHIVKQQGKEVPANLDIESALYKIDPRGRPLFAVMAALSIADNYDIRGWSKTTLLEEHYLREKVLRSKVGYGANELDYMADIAAFATITGGLSVKQLQVALGQLEIRKEHSNQFRNGLYRLFAPVNESATVLCSPIEPDVIGEYFVIRQLEQDPEDPFEDNSKRDLIFKAWDLNPAYTCLFVERLFQDFPNDPMLTTFIDLSSRNLSPETVKYYGDALSYIVAVKWFQTQLESEITPVYDWILLLERKYPEITSIFVYRLMAIDNIMTNSNSDVKLEFLQTLFKEATEICKDNSGNVTYYRVYLQIVEAMIRVGIVVKNEDHVIWFVNNMLSQIKMNRDVIIKHSLISYSFFGNLFIRVIEFFFAIDKPDMIENVLTAINSVSDLLPDKLKMAVQHVTILSACVLGFAKKGLWEEASSKMELLIDLRLENPAIQEIQEKFSETALLFFQESIPEKNLKWKVSLLQAMSNTCQANPGNNIIKNYFIDAMATAIKHFEPDVLLAEATELCDLLVDYNSREPFDEHGFSMLALTLNYQIIDYGEFFGNLDQATLLFDKLVELMNGRNFNTEKENDIYGTYILATTNMVIICSKLNKHLLAFEYMDKALDLMFENPIETNVRNLMNAAGNLVVICKDGGYEDNLRKLYERLKTLAKMFTLSDHYYSTLYTIWAFSMEDNPEYYKMLEEYSFFEEASMDLLVRDKRILDYVVILAMESCRPEDERSEKRTRYLHRLKQLCSENHELELALVIFEIILEACKSQSRIAQLDGISDFISNVSEKFKNNPECLIKLEKFGEFGYNFS